ncbi:hypothetical protein HRG_007060 [Hirsutella rhossiliensis]|uniref:Uncharacterized protein n=1 Tax=Hirsutella rhossiliensis TaxID=111463 RepID=A0A9P8MVG4_9HYPO|nr:uncharacterized protein HRG_07060 [Hirsutella rhossiliensis]KAH0961980.1 hypothetical protein HRG_07060 [Hirsutella rhossiliensis]
MHSLIAHSLPPAKSQSAMDKGRSQGRPSQDDPASSLKLSAYDQASQSGRGVQWPSASPPSLGNSAASADHSPQGSTVGQRVPPRMPARHGVSGRRTVSTRRAGSLEVITEVPSWEEGDDTGEEKRLLSQKQEALPAGGCWSWLCAKGKQALRLRHPRPAKPLDSNSREANIPARTRQTQRPEAPQEFSPRPRRFSKPLSPAGSRQEPTGKGALPARQPNTSMNSMPGPGLRRSNGRRGRCRAPFTRDESERARQTADGEIQQMNHETYAGINWQHPFLGL